jgi:hypothetical protein
MTQYTCCPQNGEYLHTGHGRKTLTHFGKKRHPELNLRVKKTSEKKKQKNLSKSYFPSESLDNERKKTALFSGVLNAAGK